MSYRVSLRRAAENDIAQAQAWYEAKRPGLGGEFTDEIARILARIEKMPLIYAMQHKEARRAVLHRFPYLLWYRVIGSKIQVLAVTDARQNPEKTHVKLS